MENLVALVGSTDEGRTCYFMTWGRIQHAVDPTELEAVVLAASRAHKTPGTVLEVRLCDSLQDASAAPMFFECYFDFCQRTIPFGPAYAAWRASTDERMRNGYDISSVGPFI